MLGVHDLRCGFAPPMFGIVIPRSFGPMFPIVASGDKETKASEGKFECEQREGRAQPKIPVYAIGTLDVE